MGALGSHMQSALGSRAFEAKAWEGPSCLVIKWPESVHRGVAHSNLPAGQRAAHLSRSHHRLPASATETRGLCVMGPERETLDTPGGSRTDPWSLSQDGPVEGCSGWACEWHKVSWQSQVWQGHHSPGQSVCPSSLEPVTGPSHTRGHRPLLHSPACCPRPRANLRETG